jgi:RND family efflux transporter MFP subunit
MRPNGDLFLVLKKHNAGLYLTAILSVLLLTFILAGCSEKAGIKDKNTGAGNRQCVVETYAVTAESTPRTVELSGVTEPIRQATPAARVMAKVLSADFYEGEYVENGRTLVSLDTRDLQTRKSQARASLVTAQNALNVARTNLARKKDLYKTATIPLAELEASELAESQASSAVSTANSAINEIDVNLSYAEAKAPFAGKIIRKMTEAGNMVAPGQPLFIIEDYSRLRIIAPAGTDLAASLRPGDKITVKIGEEKSIGIIEGIVSSGDARSPGQRVQMLVDNAEYRYKTGVLAVVETPLGKQDRKRLTVPKDALVRLGQLCGVYVAENDRLAHLRWLSVIENRDGSVNVLTGLSEGERIIMFPAKTGVVDGQRISETHK